MENNKIVWLCHLANQELNKKYNKEVDMCAYWMTQFIDIIRGAGKEIHIVSPNYYTNSDDYFILNDVHYHLYKYYSGLGSPKSAIVECSFFNRLLKNKISQIIESIKPQLVHLFGAENITYSQGVLPFIDKLPTVLSVQGYIQNADQKGSFFRKYTIKQRTKNEDEILKRIPHVTFEELGNESKLYYLKKYGYGTVHTINFPIKRPLIDASKVEKVCDIVFWGRVTVDKGVEDLINSIALLKKRKQNITCQILGGGSRQYQDYLKSYVKKLGVDNNVLFGGFQKTNEDLFNTASKSRVYVLPTHYDALPGSIRESMLMKIPVVSYPVGDIPLLNKDRESILLAKYRDTEELARCIMNLLTNEELYNRMMENGYKTAYDSCDELIIREQILNTYNSILN